MFNLLTAATPGLESAATGFLSGLIGSVFGGRSSPNPNDWMGWDSLDTRNGFPLGTNAANWIINDGSSIQNEALNIVQYIKNVPDALDRLLGYKSHFKRTITIEDLYQKLRKGGYPNEVEQIKSGIQNNVIKVEPGKIQSSSSNILYILLAVVAFFFIFKKKR